MLSFLICLALLIGGYFVYGKVVENTFGPGRPGDPRCQDQRRRGLRRSCPSGSCFMIQLLNIAGLGPIFGALQRRSVGARGLPVDHLRHHLCRRRS